MSLGKIIRLIHKWHVLQSVSLATPSLLFHSQHSIDAWYILWKNGKSNAYSVCIIPSKISFICTVFTDEEIQSTCPPSYLAIAISTSTVAGVELLIIVCLVYYFQALNHAIVPALVVLPQRTRHGRGTCGEPGRRRSRIGTGAALHHDGSK